MQMLFLKDASGLSKSTKELDSILLLCHCYLKIDITKIKKVNVE